MVNLVESILLLTEQHNIVLYVKEGKLAFVAEQGGFPSELKQQVGQNKDAIVAYLQRQAETPQNTAFVLLDDTQARFYREDTVDAYPLTALQSGMVFHSQLSDFNGVYHDFATERLKCEWHQGHFEMALTQCIEAHPILRTGYDLSTEQQIQFVRKKIDLSLLVEDLIGMSEQSQDLHIGRWMEQRKKYVFDWANQPLWQINIFLLSSDSFEFVISFHHSILDGWSRTVLTKELYTLYLILMQGVKLPPVEPEWVFRDMVALEQQTIKNDEAGPYFTKMLEDVTPEQIPLLLSANSVNSESPYVVHRGEEFSSRSGQLFTLSKIMGVPIQAILLAAHFKVLSTVSGRNKVMTCITTNCRPAQEMGDSGIGLFLNSVPMAVSFEQMSWRELVIVVNELIRNNFKYRHYPLALISQNMAMEFSEVLFNYTHFHDLKDLVADSGEGAQLLKQSTFEQTNFKFSVDFSRAVIGDGMDLTIRYDSKLYDNTLLNRIYAYYISAFDAILTNPDDSCYQSCVLSETEKASLLDGFNPGSVDFCRQTLLHELFVQQAQKRSENIALVFGQRQVTYQELDQQTNQLAHYLHSLGVGVESLVGVAMERSVELVVSLLAILKAGGAYVPIDPALPSARIDYMLQDSQVDCLLTQAAFGTQFSDFSGHLVIVDGMVEQLAQQSVDLPTNHSIGVTNSAYMIYTSGSTGQPKGVLIEHLAIRNRIDWMQREYQLQPTDRVLQKTPYSFDVSVWEFFWTLSFGSTLVIAKPDGHRDPNYLEQLIFEQQVSVIHFVPSMLNAYIQAQSLGKQVRLLICSGEALSLELAKSVRAKVPNAQLHNLYGPTEAAVDVSYFDCSELTDHTTVPIGKRIQNTQLLVISEQGNLCPVGTVGELHIGGICLARHYHNKPQMTDDMFVNVARNETSQKWWLGRLYKTGDLVRLNRAGQLEYIGRTDFQVKIRGFRIELGEIEYVVNMQVEVTSSHVTVHKNEKMDTQLVVYVQFSSAVQHEQSLTNLREALSVALPAYMVPSAFVVIEQWPLTANGKIDTRALPAPDGSTLGGQYITPTTDTQRSLVAICSTTLKLDGDKISADANFFDLGGHSLLLIRFKAQLKEVFDVDISVSTMFEFLKLDALAAHIDETQRRKLVTVDDDYQMLDGEMDMII